MKTIAYELYIDESDEPEFFANFSDAYGQVERYLEKGHAVYISYVDKHGEEVFYETL